MRTAPPLDQGARATRWRPHAPGGVDRYLRALWHPHATRARPRVSVTSAQRAYAIAEGYYGA